MRVSLLASAGEAQVKTLSDNNLCSELCLSGSLNLPLTGFCPSVDVCLSRCKHLVVTHILGR